MQKISLFLKRQQHASVFIAFVSAGFLTGVGFSTLQIAEIFYGFSWFVSAILLLLLCFWKRKTLFIILAIISGMLLGIARAVPTQIQLERYNQLYSKSVKIKGIVSEDVTTGKHGEKQIKLSSISVEGRDFLGTIWLSTTTDLDIKRGYVVTSSGSLDEGFGSFSASMYRAKILVVENTHSDKARELRDWFSDGIRKAIPEPEASLGIGYLVGQKSSLPESLQEQLRLVGLTHIVVASGYNLTILVRFARRLFASISKYLAMLSSSLMIFSFILVTGFSPSMTRAGLVTGLSLAAWYYGRKIHPMVLLPFAAAVTVFINPGFMWGDLGWYLSFSAFAGVMILAPLFQNYFFGSKKPGTIQQILGETISAQLTTLPIIAFSFGILALFALPANLLVLPFVPLAMLFVFVAGILAVIIPLSVAFVGIPAFFVLTYMTSVIDWFASIPNVSVDISFTIFGVIIFYAILLVVAIYMQRVTRHNFRKDNIVE